MLNISVSGSLDITGGVTGGSTGGGCAVSTSPGSPLPGGLLVLGFGLVGATVVRRRRQG
jgi:MYXO-CTERM domain-containing protein